MKSILREIRDTVQKYAEIMAEVSGVDVEVADATLFRVAGTGLFATGVGQDMSREGYTYRQVLASGRLQVIDRPGHEPICRDCPRCNHCEETIEIAMPILAGGQSIGVIGLVGFTQQQRQTILNARETYLGLVEQIASFIAAKATERIERAQQQAMLSALECAIDQMEQAALVLGEDGRITMANESARRQLEQPQLEGMKAEFTATGDRMSGKTEYRLQLGERQIFVMGQLHHLRQENSRYAIVAAFTCTREMHRNLYQMISTVGSGTLVGSSAHTERLRKEIAKIARSPSTVLILGESGTGKEVAASAIWRASDRADQQFVALNCAAIPESLLESELFGYVKGAFTGADPNGRVGKFELANKGVIFLDEIGDMPLYLQAKLLRVLQERRITRIGSNQQIPIDVRVIAATNKDLKAMMAAGKFREDLYYRLNVIPLPILPLRQRPDDIPDLARFFAQRYAQRFGRARWSIPEQTMAALKAHAWPGNVRELENTVEFMVNMSDEDGVLGPDTLPRDFFSAALPAAPAAPAAPALTPVVSLRRAEQAAIENALAFYGATTEGKRKAAKALGIGLATLYRKLEQFQ